MGASSVSSNTVAGSNRKGGSLQNISSHSQRSLSCVETYLTFFSNIDFTLSSASGVVFVEESVTILRTVDQLLGVHVNERADLYPVM